MTRTLDAALAALPVIVFVVCFALFALAVGG